MITSCPKCDEQVRVPSEAVAGTHLRCPLCQQEFLADAVLDELPPLLEMLDEAPLDLGEGTRLRVDELAAETPAQVSEGATEIFNAADADSLMFEESTEEAADAPSVAVEVADSQPAVDSDEELDFGAALTEAGEAEDAAAPQEDADGDWPGLAEPEDVEAPAGFDFSEQEAPGESSGPIETTVAARAKQRQQSKKSKSPVGEVVKVALGGFVGLLIAQAILWWLPGSWKRDPLNLAPKLPGVVAFLAPAQLRDVAPVDSPETPSTPPPASGRVGTGPPPTTLAANNTGSFSDVGINQLQTPEEVPPGNSEAEPTDLSPPPGDAADTLFSEPVAGGLDDPLAGGLDIPEPTLGVLNAPSYTSAELGEALLAASESHNHWNAVAAGEPGDRRKAAMNFYVALCHLGDKVTFVNSSDKQVEGRIEAVHGILQDLGTNGTKVSIIGNSAAGWMNLGERDTDGVILAGKVLDIRRAGELFETKVRLAAKKQPVVTVMTRIDPTDNEWSTIQVDDDIVALGSIVQDPSLHLGGYEGEELVVVWGGYVTAIPK